MRTKHNANDSNTLEFTNKMKAIKKEIFETKSINGINVAGKTNKLDNIYMILLWFNQEDITNTKINIYIFSKQTRWWQFWNQIY